MGWCHVTGQICHGKNIVQFGPSFITNLLETRAYRKYPRGFDRETCPPCGRKIITASFRHVFSSTGNMERQDIRAEI